MRVEVVLVEWKGSVHVYAQRVDPAPNRKIARRRRFLSTVVEGPAPTTDREATAVICDVLWDVLGRHPFGSPKGSSGALEGGGGDV